ncbi:LysR substrate-binding domain-containing protein, partial [Stenotrophomonas maltophilia]|uniref:LysR substrate-binding domain-containing protein n=1 Tax=Stenotrophomonas maltophilia TaxID=40324 RepID=UPI001953909E
LDVLLPANHPLAERGEVRLAELSHDDFISLETGSSLQILVERSAAAEGIELSPRIEVVTFTAAVRMGEVGFGITIVPAGIAAIYG